MINIIWFVLVASVTFFLACPLCYLLGRYQAQLINKLRTLEEQSREPEPAIEKPTIIGGAYQPPSEVSTTPDTHKGAGLVETKTPERLDWEAKMEIEKLAHGG